MLILERYHFSVMLKIQRSTGSEVLGISESLVPTTRYMVITYSKERLMFTEEETSVLKLEFVKTV